MKKLTLTAFCLLFISVVALAQVTISTEPRSGGFDVISAIIGLVVGLVIGYLVGSRTKKA